MGRDDKLDNEDPGNEIFALCYRETNISLEAKFHSHNHNRVVNLRVKKALDEYGPIDTLSGR